MAFSASRRLLLAALTLTTLVVYGQAKAPRRIGWLGSETGTFIDSVKTALRERGYVEGRDIVFITRLTDGNAAHAEESAREIVALRPDLIIAGATPNTLAAKRATSTVPILMYAVADPVGAGFVNSLARPGGNITGVTNFGPELADKTVELLRLVAPNASKLAVLIPEGPATAGVAARIAAAATRLGATVTKFPVATMTDVERAFAEMSAQHIGGLVVVSNTFALANRVRIAELAAAASVPAIYGYTPQVEAGGLLSYGADPRNLNVVLAEYIDKILKGVRPADLPVQQPAEFELAINLKAARALGITFPPQILARADRRVE
jgi:putative ABC transport system substrate-binding protein